jgi:hypothetical protein
MTGCARAVVSAVAILVGACGGDGGATSGPPDQGTPTQSGSYSIQLSVSTVTLGVGATTLVSANVRNPAGAVILTTVQWTTSNAAVATVDGGIVTARGAGSATITASAFNVSASASVSVTAPVTLRGTGTIYASGEEEPFPGGPLNYEILAFDAQSGVETNITKSPDAEFFPSVSPDGGFLVYDLGFGLSATIKVSKRAGGTVYTAPVGGACGFVSFVNCYSVREWLADGRLAYLVANGISYGIQIVTLGTGSVQSLQRPAALPQDSFSVLLSPAGTVAVGIVGNAGLTAVRFSDGKSTPLAPGCTFTETCTVAFGWSPSGTTLYAARDGAIVSLAVDGSSTKTLYAATQGLLAELSASPDGASLAFIESTDLKILRLSDNSVTTLAAATGSIAWSPDSKSIAYAYGPQIWAINADRTGAKQFKSLPAFTTAKGLSWTK